jgi:outer membrane receptor for ferrienterochelin and colicins
MSSALRRCAACAATLLIALLAPATALAQSGTVSGTVRTADSRLPLVGARVQVLSGTHMVAIARTNEQGTFTMSAIPAGTYDVLATQIGYAAERRANVGVTAGATATVEFALRPGATTLDAVVATASRRQEKALDAPAQIAVISDEQVEQRATVTLAGHVQGVAGVDVNQGGVAQSNIVARGFNNAFSGSMLMMQDYRFAGVPSLRVNIPLLFTGTNEDIERVEVLLGPASALFGPNSANGVLHVISKSPFTSQGTTITVDGGERSMFRGALRTAHTFGNKVGVKLSGEYMSAKDFEYNDPGEPDSLTRGGVRVANVRDFDVERMSGEARLDLRPRDGVEAITTLGITHLGSGLELTGANGTAQIKNWRFMNLQQRFSWNRFFVQGFVNSSDAGNKDANDLSGTFLLRSGQPIVDQSQVYSLQAQHASDIGTRLGLTYGADFIYTNPTTGGTINGKNEDIDNVKEGGVYVQGTAKLTDKFDLLGALRADQHELIEGTFVSPRAALIFKPSSTQNARITYNRAFNTPQNFSFFLDLVNTRNPGGLPFDVRAMGNPPKEGWKFNRSCAGAPGSFCMRSAFIPSTLNGGAMMSAYAGLGLPGLMTGQRTPLINGISAALQAGGVPPANATALATGIIDDLRTSRPELANIATVIRNLGSATVIDPASIRDIDPLKATFNNMYEVGYKGLAGKRLSFDIATWYQGRGDVATPAALATPNVFMDPTSFSGYAQPRIQAILQGAGFPPAQASATATAIAGNLAATFAPAPMGVITFDNARLAPGADVLATYRILDYEVKLWGTDVGLDYVLTDAVTLSGTFGYASKVVFDDVTVGNGPFSLNAPGYKASLTGRYQSRVRRWGGEIRGRYLDGFPVNSGVYSSYGTFVNPNGTGPTFPPYSYGTVPVNMLVDAGVNWRFPFAGKNAMWSVNVTNLLNNERPTFAGVPPIGRLAITRLQYSF